MWIIPNNLDVSACVRDTLESSWDLKELSEICERSLMWRSKPSLVRTWLQRLKKVNWMRLWFFGENVSGHLTLGFPTVQRSLRNLGYRVEAGLFTAAECGAPHKRERLFILAKSSRTTSGYQDRQAERRIRQKNVSQGNGKAGTVWSGTASELADTKSKRFETSQQSRNEKARPRFANQNSYGMWPARPGQPQYEWEEPRVVANTSKQTSKRLSQSEKRKQDIQARKSSGEMLSITDKIKLAKALYGQAQSRLGRAVNGPRSRVDRLRLLGNGVVPQQAEKAFRELIKLFQ